MTCSERFLEFLGRLMVWAANIIESLFPWPFVIIFLTLFLFLHDGTRGSLSALLRRIKRLKFYDAEIELTEDERKDIQSQTQAIRTHLIPYRDNLVDEIHRLTSLHQLKDKINRLCEEYLLKEFPKQPSPTWFRLTIYVPDFLLDGRLCQLVDYWPNGRGQVGRTFSIRYGIIGKVWRSEIDQIRGRLLREDQQSKSESEKVSIISSDWGMDKIEARNALRKPSYCTILLKSGSDKTGVLYIDSDHANAFGKMDDDPALIEKIEAACLSTGVTAAVNQIVKALDPYSPRIRLD